MWKQLQNWNTENVIINATYVEQKLKDFANKKGQETYEFLREDFKECLELFETDLSKGLNSYTVSRLINLYRMMYGNRTEIETGLVRV